MKCLRSIHGYTLIELMVVVSIIAILSSVTMPKLGFAVKKVTEGTNKGNLAVLRSAVNVAYAANDATYPKDNLRCLVPHYILNIPTLRLGDNHLDSAQVTTGTTLSDSGMWFYNNVPGDPDFGTLKIACLHKDTLDNVWSSY